MESKEIFLPITKEEFREIGINRNSFLSIVFKDGEKTEGTYWWSHSDKDGKISQITIIEANSKKSYYFTDIIKQIKVSVAG